MKKFLYVFLTLLLCALPLSVQAQEKEEPQPVVIIGSGVGALTAAVYLQRAGINTLVLEGQNPGGAIAQSPNVQNWPGETEIDGLALVEKIRKQAEANGAKFVSKEVTSVDFTKRPLSLSTRDVYDHEKVETIEAQACIIAMGSMPKFLGVPGESGKQGYWTRGVYSCAVCDGALYKGKTVAVIGGGDAAILEADYLSKIAKKVYVILRSDQFRTVEILRKNALIKKSNVEVLYNTKINEIAGNGQKVTHLNLSTENDLAIDGVFIAIGSQPNTEIFNDQLQLDSNGYIALQEGQKTSATGVFAIGDIVDPHYKQAISAAGHGAQAALQVERYLSAAPTQETITQRTSAAIPVSNQIYREPLDFVNFGDSQSVSDLNDREEGDIESISPTSNRSKMDRYDGPKNSQNLTVRGITELSDTKAFYKAIGKEDTPLVVEFYSPLCGPCKQLSPELEKAATNYQGKVRFMKIDVTQFSDLANVYNVYGVPTMLIFDNQGKIVKRSSGFDEISKTLKNLDDFYSK